MKDKEKLQGERITRAGSYDQERFGLVDISGVEGRARIWTYRWCLVNRKKLNLVGSYMCKSHVVENSMRLELKQNKGDLG